MLYEEIIIVSLNFTNKDKEQPDLQKKINKINLSYYTATGEVYKKTVSVTVLPMSSSPKVGNVA